MIHEDDRDVAEALRTVAPDPAVPDGLLAGARRKRARTRALAGTVGGLGAAALAVGIALPAMLRPTMVADNAAQEPAPAATAASQLQDTSSLAAPATEPSAATNPSAEAAALAAQRLGWDVVVQGEDANRVVSPSSLSLSLAMLAEGARGDSLASIDETLGLAGEERAAAFSALRGSLSGYATAPGDIDLEEPPAQPAIHLANRLVTIDTEALPEFVSRLESVYDVPLVPTDRGSAQGVLDAWVNEHTAGLIEKSGIEVTPDTKVVIQDSLLFAAAWQTPFEFDDLPLDFDDAGTVEAVQGIVTARYAESERWTAVRLPYDARLAADVILPAEGMAPTELTADDLVAVDRALEAAPEEEIDVTMPELDLAAKSDLIKALPAVDLTDLSGIIPDGTIEQWVQQSVLQVSAKGTVGAAVTEAAVREALAQSDRRVVVDRGYVFRVADTETDWPLFLASVTDPAAN